VLGLDTGRLLRLDMLNQFEKSSGRERRSFCLDANRRLEREPQLAFGFGLGAEDAAGRLELV
jgi:hypothetical protein